MLWIFDIFWSCEQKIHENTKNKDISTYKTDIPPVLPFLRNSSCCEATCRLCCHFGDILHPARFLASDLKEKKETGLLVTSTSRSHVFVS